MTEIERNEYIRNSTEPTAVLMEKFHLSRQRIHKIRKPDQREAFPLPVGRKLSSETGKVTFHLPKPLLDFVDSKRLLYQTRSSLLVEIVETWAKEQGF